MGEFEQLREISKLTRFASQEQLGREKLVRFLDRYSGSAAEQPIVDSLCARFGLYPYMSPLSPAAGVWEALAVELHSPPELGTHGFAFHSEQQRVYERLMDGESVILSAPTSFGKSIIIDALVASGKWDNMVLIVPTIALIDETRRRLAQFHEQYRIVTHPSEVPGKKNLIVMTQERFLEIPELPRIDFFMIDEFYKLGSGAKKDSRRTLLNLAWNKLNATGAQFYLLGPNIDGLDERLPEELREKLVCTDFRPVAVDVIDRSKVEDQASDLVTLIRDELEAPSLVFTGSPQKAAKLGKLLTSAVRVNPEGFAFDVAEWIGANYDPEWDLVHALKGGVAVHTGPLPRGLQRVLVRLFNDGHVPVMVCTSTLIEGVNTSARNVVIFEKKIDGQLIDFFTFSNIRGRAGRMFRHFVGRVVTYMKPPENSETIVDIPIESQSDLASDADLVQIDAEELSPESRSRLVEILTQQDLSIETIRKNRGFDPDLQISAARHMGELSFVEAERLSWTGAPNVDDARSTLKFAFENLLEPVQRRGINFNMLWGKLQNARANAGDFKSQVDQQLTYAREGQTRSDVVEDILRFQRNWMGFTIPSMVRALQSVQSDVLGQDTSHPVANYEYLLREVEGLYLPSGVVELEDYGVPTPLGVRLVDLGLRGSDLSELLGNLVSMASNENIVSKLSGVEQWILGDVVEGLTGNSSVANGF